MQRDESRVDAANFHSFKQFATEMQSCCRCGYGSFVGCVDGLEVLHVLFRAVMVLAFVDNVAWQGRLSEGKERAFELVVVAVV